MSNCRTYKACIACFHKRHLLAFLYNTVMFWPYYLKCLEMIFVVVWCHRNERNWIAKPLFWSQFPQASCHQAQFKKSFFCAFNNVDVELIKRNTLQLIASTQTHTYIHAWLQSLPHLIVSAVVLSCHYFFVTINYWFILAFSLRLPLVSWLLSQIMTKWGFVW